MLFGPRTFFPFFVRVLQKQLILAQQCKMSASTRQGTATPFHNAAFAASDTDDFVHGHVGTGGAAAAAENNYIEEKTSWFDIDGGGGAAPPAIAGGCGGDTATSALTNFIWMSCAFSINHGVVRFTI